MSRVAETVAVADSNARAQLGSCPAGVHFCSIIKPEQLFNTAELCVLKGFCRKKRTLGGGLHGKSELVEKRPQDWLSQSFTWAGLVKPTPTALITALYK